MLPTMMSMKMVMTETMIIMLMLMLIIGIKILMMAVPLITEMIIPKIIMIIVKLSYKQ